MKQEKTVEKKLSRAAIETLAIIVYHQPVTRAEIEEIRGVAFGTNTLEILMELNWVKPGGRKDVPGKPIQYVTTDDFLSHFNLQKLSDLPTVDELGAAGLIDSTNIDNAIFGSCNFYMSIGIWQIAIVVILVVLLFGRGKISSLMGDVAKGIKSFKKGMASDVTDDNEPKNISEDNQDNNKKD